MITKDSRNLAGIDYCQGEVILIDKRINKTSFNVIYKIRKTIQVQKVGHAGTLDPRATGLLIICTGRKTKEIENFQSLEKTYTGTITLGKTTSSMDSETEFIKECDYSSVTNEQIEEVRKSFVGAILQTPPMFSAVKYRGKSLYKYARKGVEIERQPRRVCISNFIIHKIELPVIHFEINCSKGTYIRVIAHDFGKILGCGAYLSSLRRTRIGEIDVSCALSIDEFMERYTLPEEA